MVNQHSDATPVLILNTCLNILLCMPSPVECLFTRSFFLSNPYIHTVLHLDFSDYGKCGRQPAGGHCNHYSSAHMVSPLSSVNSSRWHAYMPSIIFRSLRTILIQPIFIVLLFAVGFSTQAANGLSTVSNSEIRSVLNAKGSSIISAPLERQPPRRMRKRSSRGFPSHVRIFERPPTRTKFVRILRSFANKLGSSNFQIAGNEKFSSRTVAIDLLGGITRIGEYYARIYIGNQPIRVQIDTGSSTLAIPVAECDNCQPSDQRYNPHSSETGNQSWISCTDKLCRSDVCDVYKCNQCSHTNACCAEEFPSACAFMLKYGDGSGAQGGLMEDTMKWGNVTAPVIFGAILHDTEDFERSLVDGILGMAYESLACNPTCVEPPFQQMVKAGVVNDEFTICITPKGGKLILGAFDKSLATSSVSYVPLSLSDPPTFYTMEVSNKLKIGTRVLQLDQMSKGILDSGTTLIVVSTSVFRALLGHLLTYHCDIPGLCETKSPWFMPSACVLITPDELAKLPSFTFTLGPKGEYELELRGEDYMIPYEKNGKVYRCVGIMTMDEMSSDTNIIFGNTVMIRYITHYDRANKRLGFAEAKQGCGGASLCGSYTTCEECASASGCSFDFSDGSCRDSSGGLGIIPYPQCQGDSCPCKLGAMAGLAFGTVAGTVGSVLVVAIGMFVLAVYRKRRWTGSDVGTAFLEDQIPLDAQPADDDDGYIPPSRDGSGQYIPVSRG